MWTAFQAHFIEDQAEFRKYQQMARQGGYEPNNLEGIEDSFTKLSHDMEEDREEVTNLNETNFTLTSHFDKYGKNLLSKEAYMKSLHNKVSNLQEETNNLKAKIKWSGTTAKGCTTSKVNTKREYNPHPTWRSRPYWCNHIVINHDGDSYHSRVLGHMEKCTVLNIVKGRKICLPEKTWWLGTDKGRNMIKISEKLNDTNAAKI